MTAHLDEEQIQLLLRYALGDGGLGDACESGSVPATLRDLAGLVEEGVISRADFEANKAELQSRLRRRWRKQLVPTLHGLSSSVPSNWHRPVRAGRECAKRMVDVSP